jgi:hypothetical protein
VTAEKKLQWTVLGMFLVSIGILFIITPSALAFGIGGASVRTGEFRFHRVSLPEMLRDSATIMTRRRPLASDLSALAG